MGTGETARAGRGVQPLHHFLLLRRVVSEGSTMAGIGFVLERVIDRRGLRGLVGAAAAGVLIVAGPWLISTVALFLVGRLVVEEAPRFFAVIVYCYATTLLLFSGYHYRFTRILADALYIRDYETVRRTYRRTLVVTAVWGVAPGLAVGYLGGWRGVGLVVPVLLYTVINTGWIHTLFASLLQRFSAVTWSYGAGALAAAVATLIIGVGRINADTAVLLFTLGMLVTGVMLAIMIRATVSHRIHAVKRLVVTRHGSAPTVITLRRLVAIGAGIAVILWMDKVLYWVLLGSFQENTMLLLYPRYDQTVFVAQLLVIPPMVVFMVRVETAYFRGLRGVLGALRRDTLGAFERSRRQLVQNYNSALQGQLVSQLMMIVVLVATAPEVVRIMRLESVHLFVVTGIAAQVYFFFYTQMVNLLYLADYRAAIGVIAFTIALGLVVTVGTLLLVGPVSVGYAFLITSLAGTFAARYAERRALADFDWLVLTRMYA
ncbi:MAG: hypothetical protein EA427_02470 [Spirochaetaceae bacterium]|nr:MAG: hypothetical protein EA427_02470 [Spirochaetaceae bacterium]